MILLSSRFLKREKERKHWVHPILRYRDDGEGTGEFNVYFRMSEARFDALLAILEPLIKRRPPVSVNLVCCEMK